MIRLICVGKMKDKGMKALEQDYIKRLLAFNPCQLIELKEANPSYEDSRIIAEESQMILDKIKDGEKVILFDLKGQALDSVKFAEKIDDCGANFSIVVGGSLGFDDRLRRRADLRISLSPMTFPHLLARVIILEQVYRAYKIIKGQTYHK